MTSRAVQKETRADIQSPETAPTSCRQSCSFQKTSAHLTTIGNPNRSTDRNRARIFKEGLNRLFAGYRAPTQNRHQSRR